MAAVCDTPLIPSQDHSTPSDPFQVGATVRLVGLATGKYNSHVGQVTSKNSEDGRLKIELHRVVWASSDAPSARVSCLALKPENLRLCSRPMQRSATPTQLGTLSSSFLRLLLGERGWGLPFGVIGSVVEHLSVLRVEPSAMSVTGCSSTRGDFPIQCVLDDSKGTWWISKGGACVNGQGTEFLEFSFGGGPRRLSFVGISIPPLPNGPLSVRRFHLAVFTPVTTADGEWKRVQSDSLVTLDVQCLQEFALVPPVETSKIRLYCTQNAIADVTLRTQQDSPEEELTVCESFWCMGLFKVRFA